MEWCVERVEFSVMGMFGRNYSDEDNKHIYPQRGRFLEVPHIVRGYLINTPDLLHLRAVQWKLDIVHDQINNDDILLCQSINKATGKPLLLMPKPNNQQYNLCFRDLPEPHAVWQQPEHESSRSELRQLLQRELT
jgi:hypothetical protein